MFQQYEAPRFGRVRLERETSAELLRILYEERGRCLTAKSDPETPEAEKAWYRARLRAITRVWRETARMMDELGWERPHGDDTTEAT